MPKDILVQKFEDMSVLESVPYRPWCEGEHQDGPMDFSLKGKKKKSGESNCSRSQLLVRTPDSGFSSPSENEFVKKQPSLSSNRLMSVNNSFQNFCPKSPPTSSLSSEEQTAPLALVKKKKSLSETLTSPSPQPDSVSPSHLNSANVHPLHSPGKDSNFLQSSTFHLLSSSLYWPHSSIPVNHSLPLTSLVSSYDLNLGHNDFTDEGSNHHSSHQLHGKTTPISNKFSHSTPIKSPPRSPEESIASPIKRKTPSCSVTPEKKTKSIKKTKTSRRLNFDEDKTSPVSGTIIRQLEEGEEPLVVRKGDIDPAYNVVEITEEAKAELSKIENKIGDYVCRLCKELYDDAFGLAQHRCSRIIHVEYRCPECDKVFNCPANLASHRRWHKPKGSASLVSAKSLRNDPGSSDASKSSSGIEGGSHSTELFGNNGVSASTPCSSEPPDLIPLPQMTSFSSSEDSAEQYDCSICYKKFKKQSYLRKHLITHKQTTDSEDADDLGSRPLQPLRSPQEPPHPIFSPTSPPMMTPMLSPPFPDGVFRCRMCSATFFTPAALQLHSSTLHGADDLSPPLIPPSFAHLPTLPHQYPAKGGGMLSPSSLYSSYPFLHRSTQISAPS